MTDPIAPSTATDPHPLPERIRAIATHLGTMIDLGTNFLGWPGGGADRDDGEKMMASGVDLALVRYAKEMGYTAEAPKR